MAQLVLFALHCKFGIFREGFFRETWHIENKIHAKWRNHFTDEGKLCHSRQFLRRKYAF